MPKPQHLINRKQLQVLHSWIIQSLTIQIKIKCMNITKAIENLRICCCRLGFFQLKVYLFDDFEVIFCGPYKIGIIRSWWSSASRPNRSKIKVCGNLAHVVAVNKAGLSVTRVICMSHIRKIIAKKILCIRRSQPRHLSPHSAMYLYF